MKTHYPPVVGDFEIQLRLIFKNMWPEIRNRAYFLFKVWILKSKRTIRDLKVHG